MPDNTTSSGGKALADQLDNIARERDTRGPKSAVARFKAMTRSKRAAGYLDRAGVSTNQRTRRGWASGRTTPSAANSRAITEAYETWKRDNLRGQLARRTVTVEIYPDQAITSQSAGAVGKTDITISRGDWNAITDAWSRGDTAALDRLWLAQIRSQLTGSPDYRAYLSVNHVAFS